MVGGEFVRNILHANGGGVTGIYGRQFSEIVFLGVGFGVDTYIYKAGKSTTTITDADRTQLILGHRLYLGTMVCQRSRFIGNPLRFLILFPEFLDIRSA